MDHILATIPVNYPAIFKGIVKNVEYNSKQSPAYEMFSNLVKLANNYGVEVAFNQVTFDTIIIFTHNKPNNHQIDSIPILDKSIRGMLDVMDETLSYLEFHESDKRRKFKRCKDILTPEEKLLFDFDFAIKGGKF